MTKNLPVKAAHPPVWMVTITLIRSILIPSNPWLIGMSSDPPTRKENEEGV